MHTSGEFVLHGGDTAFANRQKLLFDKLSVAEQECNKNKTDNVPTNMDIDEGNRPQPIRAGQKRKNEMRRFRGKESIFKRPEGPAPKASLRGIPDHRRNPHKWTKYSLDDVSNDAMTEQSNTRAALSFLKELKARKLRERASMSEQQMDIDEEETNQQDATKIVFKSRKIKSTSKVEFKKSNVEEKEAESSSIIVDHDNKPIFRSSKVIMPEYVVGQKQKKKSKKPRPTEKVLPGKQLKLDHLDEVDEEET